MTYVVTENCIRCKYMDCVEVCPVDCFYVGENMLVIQPDECIDCGVCEPECPVDAIKPEGQLLGFDYDRCIRCYCCIEVCPSGALRAVETIAGRIVRRVAAAFLPPGKAG